MNRKYFICLLYALFVQAVLYVYKLKLPKIMFKRFTNVENGIVRLLKSSQIARLVGEIPSPSSPLSALSIDIENNNTASSPSTFAFFIRKRAWAWNARYAQRKPKSKRKVLMDPTVRTDTRGKETQIQLPSELHIENCSPIQRKLI